MAKKQLTLKEYNYLNGIYNRTKSNRIKMKLLKRISEGTIEYFSKWISDKESHKTIDHMIAGIKMPSTKELIQKYGKTEV